MIWSGLRITFRPETVALALDDSAIGFATDFGFARSRSRVRAAAVWVCLIRDWGSEFEQGLQVTV